MSSIRTKITFQLQGDPNKALLRATQQAFAAVAGELTGRFDDAISGNYWPWPRQSKRFGGGSSLSDVAAGWKRTSFNTGSPRSIVDSGDLKQSREFNLNKGALTAEWNWSVDYAAAVHEGAVINPFGDKSRSVRLPPRPWTTAVLEGGTSASGIQVYDVQDRLRSYVQKFLR